MIYSVLKLVHVGAVVMFLGNIATGVFWKRNADRSRDPRIIVNTMEGIIRSDRLFTIPGVGLIVAAGIATAIRGHVPILRTGWVFWGLVLFALSGWAFMAQVAPLQRKLLAAAREGEAGSASDWRERYERLSRRWDFWGAVALGLPLLALALMVLKPGIPGL